MSLEMRLEEWLRTGRYLPKPLRDFHDQKRAFKAIHGLISERPDDHVKRPDWIAGQCYVIDVFLWFMASCGYTLQKTHKRGDFYDFEATVKALDDKRREQVLAEMKREIP